MGQSARPAATVTRYAAKPSSACGPAVGITAAPVAEDDILLSPAHGRAVCYIGASTLVNSTEVFERFEPLMKRLGGAPHWGKNATVTQQEVAAMYPATYERFRRVRDRYDPKRVFTNTLLSELFP